MSTTDLLLSTFSTKSVTVHPLVLLSIQDHFHRVAKGTKKRVVGILLGQDLGTKGYEITNSFAGEIHYIVLYDYRVRLTRALDV